MNILILPFSRFKSPYQRILIESLRNSNNTVVHGSHYKCFPIIRNSFKRNFEEIRIDWDHQWYLKKPILIRCCLLLFLTIDIILVKLFFKVKLIKNIHNIFHHEFQGGRLSQYFMLLMFVLFANEIRFFTIGQMKQFSKLVPDFLWKNKYIVIRELCYKNFYANVSGKTLNSSVLMSGVKPVYLLLGDDRKNKRYYKFIYENRLSFSNKSLIITSELLFKKLKQVPGLQDVELLCGSDEHIHELFQKIDILILPYDDTIFNSGMARLARSYNLKILSTKRYAFLQDFRHTSRSEFLINGQMLSYSVPQSA